MCKPGAAGEPSTRVEMCYRVAVNERTVVSREAIARILHGGREGVPVDVVRPRRFRRWDGCFEVVGFEIAIERKG